MKYDKEFQSANKNYEYMYTCIQQTWREAVKKYRSGDTTLFGIDTFDIYSLTSDTTEQVLLQAEMLEQFQIINIR